MSTDLEQLNNMIIELNEVSKRIGLKMNLNKTKVINNAKLM